MLVCLRELCGRNLGSYVGVYEEVMWRYVCMDVHVVFRDTFRGLGELIPLPSWPILSSKFNGM